MEYNKYLRVLETTLSTEVSKTFSLSTSDHSGIATKECISLGFFSDLRKENVSL